LSNSPKDERLTFRPREHLRRKRDFERVYADGVRVRTRNLILYALPNGLPHSRVGVVTGRKVGKAVRRNRARRLFREAFRRNRDRLACPCDLVLIASPSWEDLKLHVIEPELVQLIEKANALARR